MPRKMISFHAEALGALEDLAADRMATFQELADEAFDDLLKKHGRPVGLKASLRKSATGPHGREKPKTRSAKPRRTGRVGTERY